MSEQTTLRDLFDRWERVWHEGQYDLIPTCIGRPTSGTTKPVTGRSHAKPTQRRLPRRESSDRPYGSLCTITHSRAPAPGSALR